LRWWNRRRNCNTWRVHWKWSCIRNRIVWLGRVGSGKIKGKK